MADKLRVGVIGAGGIAQSIHLPNYQKQADKVELVAIADVAHERAQQAAEQFGIRHHFADYEQMLREVELDAVSICTPNKFHAPAAIAALQAGCHVLCEKPPAMTVAEAEAMAEAAARSGKILTYGLHYRYTPEVLALKRFIDAGELGEVYAARSHAVRRRGIPAWGAWFFDRERSGGGPLIDLGVHMLDVTLWLLGNPNPVAVTGKTYAKFGPRRQGAWPGTSFAPNAAYTVEDFASAFIQLDNDATVLLETSWASHIEEERAYVEFLGTEGGVRWEWNIAGKRQEVKWFRNEHGVPADVTLHFDDQSERVALLDHFVTSITENTTPLCTAEQGLTIAKVLEAIYESSEQGRQVRIEW
ncbi:MAG: Gfo/Idh/MocA family oxidoreductase [Alicyclobacillus shizuokensis]|nr:Gfo/Idh/MocA family oxidoreductase [Alicyclobacillus shizuokensis]